MASLDPARLRYMLITDRNLSPRPLIETVQAALENGFTAVQLREKDLPASELYELAVALRDVTRQHRALLIVNDRVDVALAAGADAAQLGWQSLGVPAARKAAGDRLAFGRSAHNVLEVRKAIHEHADFILFGPVFPTPSKRGLVEPCGVESLHAMAVPAPMPVVAVGGIDKTNVAEVMKTRAAGVALIRAVMAADDPGEAAQEIVGEAPRAPETAKSRGARFFPREDQ